MRVVSHRARFDGARRAQAWNVLRAIVHPCAVSARQIGTTPNRARCPAMNLQITSVAGRSRRLRRRPLGVTTIDLGLADPRAQGFGGHPSRAETAFIAAHSLS